MFVLSQQNLYLVENQSSPCAFAHPVSTAWSPGISSPTDSSLFSAPPCGSRVPQTDPMNLFLGVAGPAPSLGPALLISD